MRYRHPVTRIVAYAFILMGMLVPMNAFGVSVAQDATPPQIAFMRDWGVWLMNADGTNQREIVAPEVYARNLQWSPSGRYLLASDDRINLVYDTQSNSTLSSMAEFPGKAIGWAADADVLVSYDPNDGGRLYRVDLGGNYRLITAVQLDTAQCASGSLHTLNPLEHLSYFHLSYGTPYIVSIQVVWVDGSDFLIYKTDCNGVFSHQISTGVSTPLHADTLRHSGMYALVGQSHNTGSQGDPPSILDVQQIDDYAVTTYDPGSGSRTNSAISPAGTVVTHSVRELGPPQIPPDGLAMDGFGNDHSQIFYVTAPGSTDAALLTEVDAYAAGLMSISGDSSFVAIAIVDNPSDTHDTWTREMQGEDASWNDHMHVVRIDVESGAFQRIAANASAPSIQPVVPANDDASIPGIGATADPTVPVAETGGSGNWIAYVGTDHNIWIVQPDGSQSTQLTFDGTEDQPYAWPDWSHDGTMLVFARGSLEDLAHRGTIHIFRDGVVTQVPNVIGCSAATFAPGDEQLILVCGQKVMTGMGFDAPELYTHPTWSLISTVDLNGENWTIRIPMFPSGWSPESWPHDLIGLGWFGATRAFALEDGTILLGWSSKGNTYTNVWAPGSLDPTRLPGPTSGNAQLVDVVPEGLILHWCDGCYVQSREDQNIRLVLMSPDGATLQVIHEFPVNQGKNLKSMPREERYILQESHTDSWPILDISLLDSHTGDSRNIVRGYHSTWQPQGTEIVVAKPIDLPTQSSEEVAVSGTIVFTGTSSRLSSIWQIDISTQEMTLLHQPPTGTSAWFPRYSHAGDQIAFISTATGNTEVWTMNADGSDVNQVSDFGGLSIGGLDWLPGDSALLLTTSDEYGTYFLQMDLATGQSSLFLDTRASSVTVRPDGTMALDVGTMDTNDIVLLDSSLQQIAAIPGGVHPSAAAYADVLVYHVNAGPTGSTERDRRVYVYRDGASVQLPTSGMDDSGAAVSPDGELVAWLVTDGPYAAWLYLGTAQPESVGGVVLMTLPLADYGLDSVYYLDWHPTSSPSGSGSSELPPTATELPGTAVAENLADHAEVEQASNQNTVTEPELATEDDADGMSPLTSTIDFSGSLVFAAKSNGQWDVYVYNFVTGDVRLIAGGPGDQWAPRWTYDKRHVIYLTDHTGKDEIWRVHLDTGAASPELFGDESLNAVSVVDRGGGLMYTTQNSDKKVIINIGQRPSQWGPAFGDISSASPDFGYQGMVWVTNNESIPEVVFMGQDEWQIPGDAPRLADDSPWLVYQSGDPGSRRIHMLNTETRQPVSVPSSGNDASGPAISGDGTLVCWVEDSGVQRVVCGTPLLGNTETWTLPLGEYESIWYLDLLP